MTFDARMLTLAEAGSGGITLLTGILLLTTNILPTWHSLDLLMLVLSAQSWGTIMCVLGLGQLFFFKAIDSGWSRPLLRFWAALLIAALWGLMSYSSFFPPSGTAAPPWAVQMLGWWFINICLAIRIFRRRSGR